jgi:hypothetical protein
VLCVLHRHISSGHKNSPVKSHWRSRGLDRIPINNQRDTNILIRVISVSARTGRGDWQVVREASESDGGGRPTLGGTLFVH